VRRKPLARTHRPQTFTQVLGQAAAVRALGAAASRQEVAAAYIFSGTRGIGKTTIARIFAKALNCQEGPAEDCCGRCQSCLEIAEGRSLDVVELDAATHTGIDDVRELREAAAYSPSRDRYRIFILDEAHQLSTAAWNGLLKILEEPPSWCTFLFCTTEPHKIPPTIESRALHFSFRSPSPAQLREHLASVAQAEQIEIEDEALDLLVDAAQGSVRDGLSALDQVRAVASGSDEAGITGAMVREALGLIPRAAIDDFLDSLVDGDARSALETVSRLDEEGHDLRSFVGASLAEIRERAVAGALGEASDDASAPLEQLAWLGKVLDETERRLRLGGPERVLVDLAVVRMSRMASLPDLARVLRRLGGGPGSGSTPEPGRRARRRGPSEGPPERTDPARSSPPEPAGAPEPEAPAPPPTPSVPTASQPSAKSPPADGSLVERLATRIAETRPHAASYLKRVDEARFDGDALALLIDAPEPPPWAARLTGASARRTILAAASELAGRTIERVEIQSTARDRPGDGPAPPRRPPRSRREIMEQARSDAVIRKVFDRFGAVLIDGEPHDGPPTDQGPPLSSGRDGKIAPTDPGRSAP
jgi:DNA polymerase-3 subunit gamma/tau